MNRASLAPAVVRMLALTTAPLLTYLGVTQYNELNKVELPELPVVEEVEPKVVSSSPSQPEKRTRKVLKQTKGKSFTSWFGSSYSIYKYTDRQLNNHCKSGNVYQILRNWCNQVEFKEVEEEYTI